MLALRRKMLSPYAAASLTMKLVDLALVSPEKVFAEIISLLATINEEAIYAENNPLHTSVSYLSQGRVEVLNFFF